MAAQTESQAVYERIEQLKADGHSNADAIRQVAAERGKSENAVRTNQFTHRRKLENNGSLSATSTTSRAGGSTRRGPGRPRRSTTPSTPTVDDAVTQARALLQQALLMIDADVQDAKAALDDAQRRYDDAASRAKDRRAELQAKIESLS